MTETSTSSNNACTYTRHFRSKVSPFRHASKVPSSMRNGIGVLIVVTAAVRFSNALFDILAIWCHSEKASTFVALIIALLAVRTIEYIGEQRGGGEGVSQSPLKNKAFSTFCRP